MMNMHRFSILVDVLVVGTLLGTVARAEDFSVDLNRLAEMDETRPMPEYKLERVLIQSKAKPDPDMPEKTFDVFIRFTDFGSMRLDGSGQSGPSSGKVWKKGMTFQYGLANLTDIKVAWIKNSPDLFIVAWVVEPDARGNAQHYSHGYTIVQLRDRRLGVLMRGRCSITLKGHGVIDSSRFSFDAKEGILQEQLTRYYEKWERGSDRPRPLARPEKDEGREVIDVARINETIMVEYKLADGKLQPWKGGLIYHAKKHDELREVARFYLGPYAPRSVLLEATNANLADKYKDIPPGAFIDLDEGTEIRVPVPEKWLLENFGHGLMLNQQNDDGDH